MLEKLNGVKPWWDVYDVPVDGFSSWGIGPLSLVVERKESEWRLMYWREGDLSVDRLETATSQDAPDIPDFAEDQRFAVNGTGPSLTLKPVLPNRSVISIPETPYSVLAGEKVRIYVRTPVWVRVDSTKRKQSLLEIPVHRMSDTWFGPNQMEGEICYASTTSCKTSIDDFSVWPHGVITAVDIKNGTEEAITVERILIPSPSLALYINESGNLWTQPITMSLNKDRKTVEVSISKKPPSEAGKVTQLTPARKSEGRSIFTKSLASLIGG